MLTKKLARFACEISMNIWLRERERVNGANKRRGPVKVAFSVSRQSGGSDGNRSAVDVADGGDGCGSTSVTVQLSLRLQPPKLNGIVPCKSCGDSVGPIGLCLCRDQYEM